MRNYYKKLKKGFTLVELVVVIAVIAILAAVSVGAYFGITDSANSSNATQGIKQMKDLWTMYSVSEYDNYKNEEERAQDFCLRYAVDNGPDYIVNYAVVDIKAKSPNGPSSAYGDHGNSKGILFKVETNYPTWFLVNDKYIVEESKDPIKNNEDFNTSLLNSERINTTDFAADLANAEYVFPFKIQVVGKDQNGKDVRGFGFYRVDVTYIESDGAESKESMIVEPQTVLKNINTNLDPDQTIEFENQVAPLVKITKTGTNDAYDTRNPLDLPEKTIDKFADRISNMDDSIKSQVEFPKHSYVISDSLAITSKTLTSSTINMETYPIAFVEFNNDNVTYDLTSKRVTKTEYSYEWEGDQYDKEYGFLGLKSFKQKYKGKRIDTCSYQGTGFQISYSLEFYLEDALEKAQNSNSTYFIFLKDYNITNKYIIPSNVVIVIDYGKSIDDLMNYVRQNGSSTYENQETYITNTINEFSWSASISDIVGANPQYPTVTSSTFSTSAYKFTSSTTVTYAGTNQLWFDKFNPLRYGTSYINNETHVKPDSNLNTVNIKNGGKLTFQPGSYLMIEAIITPAAGNQPLSTLSHATLNVEEGGSIILDGANYRSFGFTTGKGDIYATNNSNVIELFKPNDYGGGAFTANQTLRNTGDNRPIFPFMNYQFDNIKTNLHITTGSKLSSLTVMNMSGGNFVPDLIKLCSFDVGSLFRLSDGSEVIKSYNDTTRKMKLEIDGDVEDSEFKMVLDENFINKMISERAPGQTGDWISGLIDKYFDPNVSSREFNFPIANMEIHINENSSLTLSEDKTRYEILPSSKFYVNGTLNVSGGSSIIFVSSSDVSAILGDTTKFQFTDETQNHKSELLKLSAINETQLNVSSDGIVNIGVYDEANDIYDTTGQLYVNDLSTFANNGTLNINNTPSDTTYELRIILESTILYLNAWLYDKVLGGSFICKTYLINNYR